MQANDLPITGPCPIRLDPFAEGDGESTEHFCNRCVKDVHVLSNMREHEARRFLHEHAGENLCIAYKVDSNGAIRYKEDDCSERDATIAAHQLPRDVVPISALSRIRRAASGRGAGSMLALALAACTPHAEPQADTVSAGGITAPINVDTDGDPQQGGIHGSQDPNGGGTVVAGEAPIVDVPPPVEQVMAGGITAPPTQPDDPTLVRNTEGLPDPFPGAKEGDTPCDPDKATQTATKSPKPVPKAGGVRLPPKREVAPLVGDIMVPEDL